MSKQSLRVILAQPRGVCAGAERAIDIVEKALGRFSVPVHVRNEILHNQPVVLDLREKGIEKNFAGRLNWPATKTVDPSLRAQAHANDQGDCALGH